MTVTISLNDTVTVRLTELGANAMTANNRRLGGYRVYKAGDEVSDALWSILHDLQEGGHEWGWQRAPFHADIRVGRVTTHDPD